MPTIAHVSFALSLVGIGVTLLLLYNLYKKSKD